MLSKPDPTIDELRPLKWTRKGIFKGSNEYPDTLPRGVINDKDREIRIELSHNKMIYQDGVWNDITNPNDVPTTVNPIVSENICLKRRVETLTRTAAISEIEVQQLKAEIKEAKEILAQLEQLK